MTMAPGFDGQKLRILFLCTGNSCRSQMAEGLAHFLKGDTIEAYSAGIDPRPLDQRAVRVMREVGVDISHYRSKHVNELKDITFDYVITVCGHANENCPVFLGQTKVMHVGFDDPPEIARDAGSEDEALEHYRRVRNEIRAFIEGLPESLEKREGLFPPLIGEAYQPI
jgi:arsenate reductase